MRKVPLSAAKVLGLYASFYRITPVIYILTMFILVPLVFLGVSAIIDASVAGGVIVFLMVLAGLGTGIFFWSVGYPMDGERALCYKVLSKEQRLAGEEQLAKANADLLAEATEKAGSNSGDAANPSSPKTGSEKNAE